MESKGEANTTDGYELEAGESKATFLVWQDLTVIAQNLRNGTTRNLLHGLNGYAEPDRIMAIMGPSGSGKSTLLDALAGRLSRNTIMTGNVLLNGKKGAAACRDASYLIQEDYFLGTLSVRETLTYSAQLRLPSEMTNNEISEIVEKTIIKMGLQDCAENKIGNWHFRGISKGEKRRLSISIEILTQPRVLFIDEVTSGLDSASAFFVLQVLRKIAHDGRIVVCSIHQPSSHLFDLFDDLLLLSCGETIYFGESKSAVKFFAEAGFPCPMRRNPSDHFLRCINSDFDKITASASPRQYSQRESGILMSSDCQINLCTEKIKEKLMQKYRNSEDWVTMTKRIRELVLCEQIGNESSKSKGKWWKQLCTLSRRSMVNMSRDMGYYWLRIIFYILVSISVGVTYFNIGVSNSAILERAKCDGFIYGFMTCLSVGGLPFFIEEYKVSHYERIKRHYGEGVFVLSNFISSLPFLVLLSMSSGTIIYYTVKFHPGFSQYTYFCINIFCCVSIVETCMMVVALVVPNILMGIGVGTSYIVFMMMASEIFRPLPDIPKFFWRYPMSYISYASWAIQGQYKNDMLGLAFDSPFPGDTKLKGDQVLQKVFAIQIDHSKWWDLVALTCLLFTYKIIFYALLKYKRRLSSLLRKLFNFLRNQ